MLSGPNLSETEDLSPTYLTARVTKKTAVYSYRLEYNVNSVH